MEIDNLPYITHINEHNLVLNNGDIFTTLKISGYTYETKSYAQLRTLKNIVLICLNSSVRVSSLWFIMIVMK